ncbi:hypothetical protein MMC07_004453 [Pseudocyphellaria aurata]|nr:hypothetical protein [Pseudocyphellaria aurata]
MSSADVQAAPTPALPDYLSDPNAVLKDASEWRYGRAPDYSRTRTVFEKTKKYNHEASSLPSLVENLVKNWEIEASFKPQLSDWRTVDRPNYSFAINGGSPQTAEHMLKVGTYNAIIAPNEFYSPAASDFASSHKTFKRMMPTFAWEVIEVYSGPPRVAFRWRHWGEMQNDYVGFNEFRDPTRGEKITAKAHNGPIDIEGVTVAQVDDQVRLQKVETWFDPLEMFRQIAPNGIVNREARQTNQTGENNDQEEHMATANAESQITEKSAPSTHPSSDFPQLPNTTDKVPQPRPNLDKASGALDLSSPSNDAEAQLKPYKEVAVTESEKMPAQLNKDPDVTAPPLDADPLAASTSTQSQNKKQLTPDSTRGPTPDSDSKPRMKNLEDGDQPEDGEPKPSDVANGELQVPAVDILPTGVQLRSNKETSIAEQQIPSNGLLKQILKKLDSVQSDFRQLSARIGEFETRVSKLEGVPSNLAGTAPTPTVGNAVATTSKSEETRRTHEEMSRISGGECPFLMNME